MKQLYIRKGNLEINKNILIIGEESTLGGRDSAYCTKGTINSECFRKDPYTKAIGLNYIHACENILLDSKKYKSDHEVHNYVKHYCKDLVKWDGEAYEGITNSREAFIVKKPFANIDSVVKELRCRIDKQVHPKGFWQRRAAKKKLKRLNRRTTKHRNDPISSILWFAIFIFLILCIKVPGVRYYTQEIVNNIFSQIKELVSAH